MNNGRRQDPVEAFASIISMMLRTIRARGWRSLKELPAILLEVMYWRRMGEAFAALVADFRAGTLAAPAPAPEPEPEPEPVPVPVPALAPWTAPPEREALSAQPPAPLRPAPRPNPTACDRRRRAVHPAVPAVAAGTDRPCAERAPAMRVCARAVPRVRALIPLPERLAGVAAVISKKIAWPSVDCRVQFVTIT
jgi:hypothetical protein